MHYMENFPILYERREKVERVHKIDKKINKH